MLSAVPGRPSPGVTLSAGQAALGPGRGAEAATALAAGAAPAVRFPGVFASGGATRPDGGAVKASAL